MECGGRIPRCTAHETHAWSGCRWVRLSLCYAPPLFQQLFAKSAGFCRQRGPPVRHSEREIGGFDSMFVSLRQYSGISLQRHQNFSPSQTFLVRMAERWSSEHLSCYIPEVAKKGAKKPGEVAGICFSTSVQQGNGAEIKKKHFRRGAGGFRRFRKPKHEWRAGWSPPETCGGSKFSKSSPPGLAGPATAELADLGLPQNPRALGNRSEITKFDFLNK